MCILISVVENMDDTGAGNGQYFEVEEKNRRKRNGNRNVKSVVL